MPGIFDPDIDTAKELIALYGQDCLWKPAAAAVDGDAPGYSTEGAKPDPIPVKIAWFRGKDVGYAAELYAALMAGTEVPTSGEVGLMAGGLTFTPDDSDTVVRDGNEIAITGIDRIAPNGTPILYFVKVSS